MSALEDLFAKATQARHTPGVDPMSLLTLIAQNKSLAGGGGSSLAGLGMDQIGKGGTALQLAERAAAQTPWKADDRWVHDPRYWYILENESGLSPHDDWAGIMDAAHADNPSSTAAMIPQFLAATQKAYGLPLGSPPLAQLIAYDKYLRGHWGGLEPAYAHKQATGWY